MPQPALPLTIITSICVGSCYKRLQGKFKEPTKMVLGQLKVGQGIGGDPHRKTSGFGSRSDPAAHCGLQWPGLWGAEASS